MIVVLHGNAGLSGNFGKEIIKAAKGISDEGYNVAVPSYYTDNGPHYLDATPKPAILADAIKECKKLSTVDPDRVGLVGYSLGAATCMSLIASESATAKVFVDYFGPVSRRTIRKANKFPPTIIFHNVNDIVVPFKRNSERFIKALGDPPHKLWKYDEANGETHHAFKPGGNADTDSKKKTLEWLGKHLPIN